MCVCVFENIYLCMYVYMLVYMYLYVRTYVCIYMHVCIYVFCVCMYVCMYDVCMNEWMYVCIRRTSTVPESCVEQTAGPITR